MEANEIFQMIQSMEADKLIKLAIMVEKLNKPKKIQVDSVIKQRQKDYYIANRDVMLARSYQYAKEHKGLPKKERVPKNSNSIEYRQNYFKNYYEENKEKLLSYGKDYYKQKKKKTNNK